MKWLSELWKKTKTYNASGLAEPFVLNSKQRDQALQFIQDGNLLGAVRLLYNAGFTIPQIQFFIAEETEIIRPVTLILREWNPRMADSKQKDLVERMETLSRWSVEVAKKLASSQEDAPDTEKPAG